MESVSGDGWINRSTIIQGAAASGSSFSRVDSVSCFGFGYEHAFLPELNGKNLGVMISGSYRMENRIPGCQLVLMLTKKDSVIYWTSVDISSRIKGTGWERLNDRFTLPSNFTAAGIVFKTYLWNANCKGYIDFDDLEITFSEMKMPSFLPELKAVQAKNTNGSRMVLDHHAILTTFDYSSGNIWFTNLSGDTLLTSLTVYGEWENEKGKKTIESMNSFRLIRSQHMEAEFSADFSCGSFHLIVSNSESLPTIQLKGRMVFEKEVKVFRWSILGEFPQPFAQIITSSDESVMDPSGEYWYTKNGFLNGKGEKKLLVRDLHLSSIQVSTALRLTGFNLDYAADHPMVHFPSMKTSKGTFVDFSSSPFTKGDTLSGAIELSVVQLQGLPVVSSYPDGFSSAMIWTEHADFSDLKTHRAVYFGSDSIVKYENACGGFARYRIPVTKSVFYQNPTHEKTTVKHGAFESESANILGTEGFNDFLIQLHAHGSEICLHSPDPYTTKRTDMEKSLAFMSKTFGSPVWIDHGYDNGPLSNREDLNADGFMKGSANYAADLWKKYGVKYFWNSFYEDSAPWKNFSFNSFFSVPYRGFGTQFPLPIFWKHPQRTEEAIHWRTTGTLDPADNSLWDYFFSEQRLNDLSQSHRAEFIHFYAPRVDSTNGYYTFRGGRIAIDPKFDQLLHRLADFRDAKKIWLTTVSDYLNYELQLEKISRSVSPEGIITYRNDSPNAIKGLTFNFPDNLFSIRLPDMRMVNPVSGQWILNEFKAGDEIQFLPLLR